MFPASRKIMQVCPTLLLHMLCRDWLWASDPKFSLEWLNWALSFRSHLLRHPYLPAVLKLSRSRNWSTWNILARWFAPLQSKASTPILEIGVETLPHTQPTNQPCSQGWYPRSGCTACFSNIHSSSAVELRAAPANENARSFVGLALKLHHQQGVVHELRWYSPRAWDCREFKCRVWILRHLETSCNLQHIETC